MDELRYAKQLDFDEISNCMRCGFCLPACPTYRETSLESASPRGRIALMKGLVKGEIDMNQAFEDAMYLCLGCRACETACPAGVQYGSLVEGAREAIEASRPRSRRARFIRRMTLNTLFVRPRLMKLAGKGLALYQELGLDQWVNEQNVLKWVSTSLDEMHRALPRVASLEARKRRPKVVPPSRPGTGASSASPPSLGARGPSAAATAATAVEVAPTSSVANRPIQIGLFTGCVMDAVFFETNDNTAKVLAAAGCEVAFVEGQACCGALHAHTGDKQQAKELAKQNIVAFERAGVDYYVNNAGGCGAALKEYTHWFHGDEEWSERAERFCAAMKDFSEILAELPQPALQNLPYRITYQDSCHLCHGQGVRNQPRTLLKGIPGAEYVELHEADRCCGSAGIYNLTQAEMSMTILDAKMEHVKDTHADVVVTANPGCLLQMRLGIQRAGLEDRMQAVHIADLLAQAIPGSGEEEGQH